MILSKKDILLANDTVIKKVHIPEWGGDVYVRSMSGEQRDQFEALIVTNRNSVENFRAKLASMTVCDEAGNLIFTEADIKELSKKSAAALQRIFIASQKLSRITPNDVVELTEALEENPLEDSASASL